jgi:ubiquinone/menaquinone biosynthesis C-methylase UbiE
MDIAKEKRTLRNFYKFSSEYLDVHKRIQCKGKNHYHLYLELISRYADSPGNLLDVGCGTGYSSSLIAQTGKTVVGLDLSHMFLCNGGYKDKIDLITADASKLPFKGESFDFIGACAVIEHIPNLGEALTEMVRILKPGGSIIIKSPNLLSPLIPIRALLNLVVGRPGIPVFAETIRQGLRTLLFNTSMSFKKMMSSKIDFTVRYPDLTSPGKPDADAANLATQLEIKRFFRRAGLSIVTRPLVGKTLVGKILSCLVPNLSGHLAVVAKKEKRRKL